MKYNYAISKISVHEIDKEGEDRVVTWSFATIKNNLDEQTSNTSFNRTREWVTENHPEYLL